MTLLVLTGDLHVNSTVALCPPEVELDDGGIYLASKPQKWIWEKWTDLWTEVADLKARHECEVVTLLNGELADDNHHATTQLISKNTEDQARASMKALEPARSVSDRFIVTRGTEAHSGLNSSMDEKIAARLRADATPDGKRSWWRYRGVIDGLRLDAAHHPGTASRRPWTRGGAANRLAEMVMSEYVEQWVRPPDLIIRGHVHNPEDSWDNHVSRAVILPAWQMTTSFGHRLGGNLLPIGAMLVLVEDGQIVWESKRFHRWPLRRWEDM